MIPRRTLLSLVALVLALHGLVLGGASSRQVRPGQTTPPQAFETRTIALAPAAAPAAPAPPPPPPRAQPAPSRRTAPAAPARRATPPAPVESARLSTPRPPVQWATPSPAELIALGAGAGAEAGAGDGAGDGARDGARDGGQDSAQDGAQGSAGEGLAAGAHAVAPAAPPDADAPAEAPAAASPAEPPEAARAAVQLPPPARLDFEVTGQAKGFGYHASAELVWQHDATSYHAHQEIKALFLGSRSQDSVGSITAHGLQPKRFGDRARSERAAHFDFAAGRVTFSANTPAAPIAPGAQDRLSVFLQLAGMLAAAPGRYPVGTQIEMTTVSARAADVWTFTVQAEQSLELPVGPMRAVPLQRLPRRDYDQKAQIWLAPSLGYLPVRIRLTEANGDFAELNLRGQGPP